MRSEFGFSRENQEENPKRDRGRKERKELKKNKKDEQKKGTHTKREREKNKNKNKKIDKVKRSAIDFKIIAKLARTKLKSNKKNQMTMRSPSQHLHQMMPSRSEN